MEHTSNGKTHHHKDHNHTNHTSSNNNGNGGHRNGKHCHRHHSNRSGKAESVMSTMSTDSDIRFTRKKLGDNQRCGCALIAGFLIILLLAATIFYIACKYTIKIN